MRPYSHFAVIIALGLLLSLACASGSTVGAGPTAPTLGQTSGAWVDAGSAGHNLWGYWQVSVDPASLECEVVPLRQAEGHWNVLQFLEQAPCKDCFKLKGVSPNPDGTLNVDVSIKHPFANKNFTGFDVRGIAMFNGSHTFPLSGLRMSDRTLGDGELLNADGYMRREDTVKKAKPAPSEKRPCLLSNGAQEKDLSRKPWLDLSESQTVPANANGEPTNPVDVTTPSLDFDSLDVCLDGRYAYMAAGEAGLQIFDISDPTGPFWVAWVDTPGYAQGVAIYGGCAYVADGDFQIIDIDPVESAHILTSVDTSDSAVGVAVSEGFAYVAAHDSGLAIVAIDPPASAHLVKSVDTDFQAWGVAVSGGYA